jgi:tetratricopeptide (TPR) repeat protein
MGLKSLFVSSPQEKLMKAVERRDWAKAFSFVGAEAVEADLPQKEIVSAYKVALQNKDMRALKSFFQSLPANRSNQLNSIVDTVTKELIQEVEHRKAGGDLAAATQLAVNCLPTHSGTENLVREAILQYLHKGEWCQSLALASEAKEQKVGAALEYEQMVRESLPETIGNMLSGLGPERDEGTYTRAFIDWVRFVSRVHSIGVKEEMKSPLTEAFRHQLLESAKNNGLLERLVRVHASSHWWPPSESKPVQLPDGRIAMGIDDRMRVSAWTTTLLDAMGREALPVLEEVQAQQPNEYLTTTVDRLRKKLAGSAFRLADPAHPARKELEEVSKIIDQCVQVEMAGDRTAMHVSAPAGEMEKALSFLEKASATCPEDMDLLVAKASVLHASAQFKSAEEVLDGVLTKAPEHFEAKMWKTHWSQWSDALRFPRWNEQLVTLHPAMAAHLRLGHRVQIVRDGPQKTVAIVAAVQGPPFDSRTEVKVEWVLSETPHGPLIAYYTKIIEPAGEPSTMEAFLPILQPALFSPMEGFFLFQQLAFTPYCFVVLVSGNGLQLNRRNNLGPKTAHKIRLMAAQLNSTQMYLPHDQFQNAMQWHMNHFDMGKLTFE